jgi:hypothetical protein
MLGSYPSRLQRQRVELTRPPSPPLGSLLTTLSQDDLANSADLHEYSARIICCEDVVSYNWLNEKEPTILVPGLHALSVSQYWE